MVTIVQNIGYVTGVMFGDGWFYAQKMKRRPNTFAYTLRLDVTSLTFARKFCKACESLTNHKGTICERERVWCSFGKQQRTHYYRVIITSKLWFHIIKRIMSKILDADVSNLNKNFIIGFISGMFDSEGWHSHYRHWTHYHQAVGISNDDIQLINFISRCLSSLGIRISGIYKTGRRREGKQNWAINLWRRDEISKFIAIIGEKAGLSG
jgi:hypothetical protein